MKEIEGNKKRLFMRIMFYYNQIHILTLSDRYNHKKHMFRSFFFGTFSAQL